MFELNYPIANARPASYNPRVIDEESIRRLRESLRTLGLIRPVIATKSGTLIAGHQRTKAMTAEGFTTCPAYVLPDVNDADEVRFNQLHNASDKEFSDGIVQVGPRPAGWSIVPAGEVKVLKAPKFAAKRNEILRLLTRYGE